MSNPVVLITGALTGIGRATARRLRQGRRKRRRRPAAGKLKARRWKPSSAASAPKRRSSVPTCATRTTCADLIDQTVARFGRIDAAVNAAGTEGQPGPVTEQTAESYAATFDTNVLGTLLSMKHELRVMQPQGRGSIINISSTYGHEGAAGASVYVASKHAVEGMTKSAALEAASSGVRVNAVAPGPTETGMLNRFTGTAERKAALG